MFRRAPLIVMVFLLSTGCALSSTQPIAMRRVAAPNGAAPDSMGRCDYGLEGAVVLGAGVAF
jgi:hypothetical protein